MNNSNNSSKNSARGLWAANQRWRDRLARKGAHKALDIPDGGTHISTGLGWKELAVLGALGIGAYHLANQPTPPTTPVPAVAAPVPGPLPQAQGWRLTVEESEGITVAE